VVHRLDYNTSGVLLFAKTSAAAGLISAQFREPGRVRKAYLAVCAARPAAATGAAEGASAGWFEVAAPLGREDRSRQGVRADGKEASTWFRLLAATERAGGGGGSDALVACRPLTGRTHQIRVHAAHAGLPLLGDDVYGVATPLLERHALHAWRISLDHPFSGERLDISAPLPDDFARAMSELGLLLPEGAEALVDVFRPGE
jgi:23S rRNA-/tRNA-specific pseudouridylate synthase